MSGKTKSMRSGPGFTDSEASSNLSRAGKTYADKKNQALAAKNTAVLSYDELERIKSMCSQTTDGEDYQTMRNS